MSPEFDPHNERSSPPASLSEFLNKQHATTGNVWSQFSLTIPKNKMGKKLVRSEHSISVSTSHLRQTDLGQIYIALYNVETTQSIPYGELFVEYDVALTIPNQTNSIKYYKVHAQTPSQDHDGIMKGALLGNDGDKAQTTSNEEFIGSGSLGISHQHLVGAGTYGGVGCDCTRFKFNEPFKGQLNIAASGHSGTMDSGSVPVFGHGAGGIAYLPDNEPASTPDTTVAHIVNTGGVAGDMLGLWNVVAKAGDILDVLWDGNGTWGFNDILVTLAEVGELLPLLI